MFWLLLACVAPPDSAAADTASDTADTAACDSATGTLHACVVHYSGEPAPGVKVLVRDPATADPPIETRAGADGCVDMELPTGTWDTWADDMDFSWCKSDTSTVTVPGCDRVEVTLNVDDLCAG